MNIIKRFFSVRRFNGQITGKYLTDIDVVGREIMLQFTGRNGEFRLSKIFDNEIIYSKRLKLEIIRRKLKEEPIRILGCNIFTYVFGKTLIFEDYRNGKKIFQI